jgi:hypothetical protein
MIDMLKDKLEHLTALKQDMSESMFRSMAATIIVNYYESILDEHSLKKSRTYMVNKVNEVLETMNVKEVSYSYLRTCYKANKEK